MIIENTRDGQLLKKMLTKAAEKNNLNFKFEFALETSIKKITEHPYSADIIILDLGRTIETISKNIDLVENVVNRNPKIYIILSTFLNSLPVEIRRIFGLLYIIKKPYIPDDISIAAERIAKVYMYINYTKSIKSIPLKWNAKVRLITENTIIYVRKARYGLVVVTTNGEFRNSNNLNAMMEMLSNDIFYYCQSSCVVNFNHIKEYEISNLVMDNGEHINISRPYQRNIKELRQKSLEF